MVSPPTSFPARPRPAGGLSRPQRLNPAGGGAEGLGRLGPRAGEGGPHGPGGGLGLEGAGKGRGERKPFLNSCSSLCIAESPGPGRRRTSPCPRPRSRCWPAVLGPRGLTCTWCFAASQSCPSRGKRWGIWDKIWRKPDQSPSPAILNKKIGGGGFRKFRENSGNLATNICRPDPEVGQKWSICNRISGRFSRRSADSPKFWRNLKIRA
jgi:hypothetical protein